MIHRTRLYYKDVRELVDKQGMGVVILTDQAEKEALTFICDSAMVYQLKLRRNGGKACDRLLPEVLVRMLADLGGDHRYEMEIYDILNGEYRTVITDIEDLTQFHIRISDAVLLACISDIPLYISKELLMRQGVNYSKTDVGGRLSIPINVLDTERLKAELEQAIVEENYRLASQITEELKRRTDK